MVQPAGPSRFAFLEKAGIRNKTRPGSAIIVMRLFLLAILLFANLVAIPQLVWAGVPGAAEAKARCPICGMFVAPYPTWQAVILFTGGSRLDFDGPRDLFRYLQEPSRQLPGRTVKEVREVWVTEYYSARPVLADEVYFIAGSDVLGPMGQELVPVRGTKPAETFMRDHGGGRLFRFDGRELKEIERD